MKLINHRTGQVIAEQVVEARSFFARGRGLLGKKSWPETAAMWISPCNNIHTWFMQFSIDAIFVDRNLVVQALYPDLKAWKLAFAWRAHSVFELAGGRLKATPMQIGDQLHVGN